MNKYTYCINYLIIQVGKKIYFLNLIISSCIKRRIITVIILLLDGKVAWRDAYYFIVNLPITWSRFNTLLYRQLAHMAETGAYELFLPLQTTKITERNFIVKFFLPQITKIIQLYVSNFYASYSWEYPGYWHSVFK